MDVHSVAGPNLRQFYIGGRWIDPAHEATLIEVANPSSETAFATVDAGSSTDVAAVSAAPFGGYKQSGNGREYAEFGLEDYLEIKGVVGYGAGHGS